MTCNHSPQERPILFSGEMVRAILSGAKTQTRRVVKATPIASGLDWNLWYSNKIEGQVGDAAYAKLHCPYGVPGDRLWVRETWMPDPPIDGWPGDIEWNGCGRPIAGVPKKYRFPSNCIFSATWTGSALGWRPSIHMPRWASRITLEVTGVRVERVQDISESDAEAEGTQNFALVGQTVNPYKTAFAALWDSINAKRGYGWDVNPWVWVIEFRRIEGAA